MGNGRTGRARQKGRRARREEAPPEKAPPEMPAHAWSGDTVAALLALDPVALCVARCVPDELLYGSSNFWARVFRWGEDPNRPEEWLFPEQRRERAR